MAIPRILLQIQAAVSGSAQVQALRAALAQLQAQAQQTMGNPFGGLGAGASAAAAGVAGLMAAVAAAAGATAGIGLAFKKGLDVNAETETAQLGIKGLVAALFDVRDAGGSLAKGPEQLAIAANLANEQVNKLRVAGLETSATFQQLMGAFQQALGAGAAAGLSLDKIRELTVGIVQAAGAIGVPMDQINQEVRSLISGDITSDSTVAKALQIKPEQVKLWKEQGNLAKELTNRLEVFKRLGPEAASTWTATMSNLGDAFDIFLGKASKGAFDGLKKSLQEAMKGAFDTSEGADAGAVGEKFVGIANVATTAFSGIGTVLSDGINAGVALAAELSGWFDQNRETVDTLANTMGLVWDNVKGVLGIVVDVVAAIAKVVIDSGILQYTFALISIAIAGFIDGFNLLKMAIAEVGGFVLDYLGKPIRNIISSLAGFLKELPVIGESMAQAAATLVKNIPTDGNGMRATAAAIRADFEAGNTAVARTTAGLKDNGKAAREAADTLRRENEKGKKTGTGGSATNKATGPSEDAKKKAGAEAKAFQKSEEDLAKAKMDAMKKIAAALRGAEMAQADADLAAGRLTHDQYMAKKRQFQAEEFQLDMLALQQQRDVIAQRKTVKKSELVAKEADLVKVDADIKVLTEKDRTAKIKLVADDVQFKRQLADMEVEWKAKLLDAQGDSLGAADARRQAEFVKLQNSAEYKASPSLRDSAGKVNAVEADKSAYEKARVAYAEHLQTLDDLDKGYKQQVEIGTMGTLEAEAAMQQARQAHIGAMADELDMMARMADASKNPQLIAAAKTAAIELNGLKNTVDSVATAINHSLADSIVDGLGKIVSGTSSVKDALRGVLIAVIDTWKKIAAQKLAESIFGKLGGGLSALGGNAGAGQGSTGINFSGIGSAVAKFFSFAEGGVVPTGTGGIISGRGTGTSDSITARLSNGEGILTAAAVRKYGSNFVHTLNHMAKGYATGGVIGGKSSGEFGGLIGAMVPGLGPKASGAGAPGASVRIINSIDPSVTTDHMDSAAGEQVIENIISRSPGRFRLAMGV